MENQINALCVSEIKRLTVLLKGNEDQLVSLYKNYSNFSKMYDQFSGDTTGTYSLLVSIIGLYISATNKLISSENIVKLYNELKLKYEEENKGMEA